MLLYNVGEQMAVEIPHLHLGAGVEAILGNEGTCIGGGYEQAQEDRHARESGHPNWISAGACPGL
ncbi:MAG: hypothetical protein HYT87_19290 [Nitrospirae bacterium]|nr:hypothetical protein [Nitrospirota bacterium]